MKGSISEFELGVLRARISTPPDRKRGAANCEFPFRSDTFGIGRRGLDWTPICVCKT